MTKAILKGSAVGNPEICIDQLDLFEMLKSKMEILEKINETQLKGMFLNTKIEKRYATMPLRKILSRTLGYEERREKFNNIAGKLAISVAKKAIAEAGIDVEDLGQLIMVSGTDFTTPGLDTLVIYALDLPRNINRTPISFQGCSAALRGLAAAKNFCLANPGKGSLVICCELNSLIHKIDSFTMDQLIKMILFGDGCSAMVILAEDICAGSGKLAIEDYSSYLVDGSKNMVEVFWNNDGSPGSSIHPALPSLVQKGVHQFVSNFLQQQNLNIADIDGWAVHPGGAKILTSVQAGLNLNMEELSSSWNILKNYGNMSSPTVCFVLKQILKKKDRKNILALAFGPGVTMEQVLMKYY